MCCLPIRFKVSCFIVCGLMEILEIPCLRSTSSFSLSILSGLPASTVNSSRRDRSNLCSSADRSRSICIGSNVVGVPPPMYIVFTYLSANSCAISSISFSSASRYRSTRFFHLDIGKDVKEQYRHVLGQNGIPI